MLKLPHLIVPLALCPDGHMRVTGTEVTLEQIVSDFEDGASADEIASRHEDLRLSDVFLVLSCYLKHRKLVEDYLASRQAA
jgi:uncharacterized protein (DUF433 family)